MSGSNENKVPEGNESKAAQAYVINERGEEVPITEQMVEQSMADVKLQSIGAHTGFNKVITDDMLPPSAD